MTSISEQLVDALGIMIMGMSLVFIFLSVLIVGISIVAKLCPVPMVVAKPDIASDPVSTNRLDPKLVAAITSAIHQYRA